MVYHSEQWDSPKDSTLEISRFLKPFLSMGDQIVDVSCGSGGALSYLAQEYPESVFLGFDTDEILISEAQRRTTERNIENVKFQVGDLYVLNEMPCDGVLSIQTLSWLNGYELAMNSILKKLKPNWFFCSSLFYEGDIDANTIVTENARARSTFYNTYSLPRFEKFIENLGYRVEKLTRFEISRDLPPANDLDLMQTYTVKSEKGNLQISGPLLMNWYFVLLVRI